MSEQAAQNGIIEVPAGSSAHGGDPALQLLNPKPYVVGLTWVTFIVMVIILYKVAWRPIMMVLETRENSIKKALEDAEKARQELARVQENSKKMVDEATAKGREMVESARESASQIAESIREKGRQEAEAMVTSAKGEIDTAVERARDALRTECGKLAIELAGRIVGENMDTEKNRVLSKKMMDKV